MFSCIYPLKKVGEEEFLKFGCDITHEYNSLAWISILAIVEKVVFQKLHLGILKN